MKQHASCCHLHEPYYCVHGDILIRTKFYKTMYLGSVHPFMLWVTHWRMTVLISPMLRRRCEFGLTELAARMVLYCCVTPFFDTMYSLCVLGSIARKAK